MENYDQCNDFPIRHINSKDCCCVCGRQPVVARSLCKAHYHKLLRYGDPTVSKRVNDGRTSHPLYQTWKGMKSRCFYEGHNEYDNYGGRGISICERWLDPEYGFWNFVEDMGEKPAEDYSIDRIDPDRDYEPENCRWAKKLEQIRNTQRGRMILSEARKNGFIATYRVTIDTDIGARTYSFERLSELNNFIKKLKKG